MFNITNVTPASTFQYVNADGDAKSIAAGATAAVTTITPSIKKLITQMVVTKSEFVGDAEALLTDETPFDLDSVVRTTKTLTGGLGKYITVPTLEFNGKKAAVEKLPFSDRLALRGGVSKIGACSYELMYQYVADGTYDYQKLINYFSATGVNLVKIMYPCFSSAEWTTHVFNGVIPVGEISDADFRPTFLSRSDAVFSALEAADIQLHVLLLWGWPDIATMFGETVQNTFKVGSTAHNFMQRFVRWFFKRYAYRKFLGAYSFFAELPLDGNGPTIDDHAAVLDDLVGIAKQYDPVAIATSGFAVLPLDNTTTRPTVESLQPILKKLARSLDALGLHVYGNSLTATTGMSYVGYYGNDASLLKPKTTNNYGYEGLKSLLSAYAAIADSLHKPLWITETGVPTTVEVLTTTDRKRKVLDITSRYADHVSIWNVADMSALKYLQEYWQIKPGTADGDSYAKIIALHNAGAVAPTKTYVGAGVGAIRARKEPFSYFNGMRAGSATLNFQSTAKIAAATSIGVMFWIRRNEDLTAYEKVALFGNGVGSGFMVVGGGTTSDSEYIEFLGTGGSAGNTSSDCPRRANNLWAHHAYIFKQVRDGSYVIETWLDGLFVNVRQPSRNYVPIADGTPCYLVGGSASGAPVAMQDFCIIEGTAINAQDIFDHIDGNVPKNSILHIRSFSDGTFEDLGPDAVALTKHPSVSVI